MTGQDPITFFEALYETTYKQALLYVTKRCADPGQIADILQDTYAQVYKLILDKGTDYVREPIALVLHTARFRLWRHYTRWGRRKAEEPLEDLADALRDPSPPLEDLAADRALLRQLANDLRQKPADVQRIFYLYYGQDMPLRQVAQALGLKESTVKTKLYRTVNELRAKYGKETHSP